jgi:diguanylate cyclase (GGDEF)-like protein
MSPTASQTSRPFNWRVFATTSLVAAVVLGSTVAIPQLLSQQARWEALRAHVGEIGRTAASVVDGDLHRRLLDPANYTDALYNEALKPLIRFHSADPNIHYLYTMVDRGGVAYFVLDTAGAPGLKTDRKLEKSAYMERFDVDPQYPDDGWLQQLAAGKTYVNPTFEKDDYGTFLTATSPIYDSQGRYSGFVGVDFDLDYYVASESRFRAIAIGSMIVALLGSLAIGYIISRYHSGIRRRMQELYESSIRDNLTGLLNRRGAMSTIGRSLAEGASSYAMLLVDIDNLKLINDLQGQTTGDAVLARVAAVIRDTIGKEDKCARFGGDEFLVLSPNCDAEGAMTLAREILGRLSHLEMPLAGASFRVSIGVSVHEGKGAEFATMYADADAALHFVRSEGKTRIGLFTTPAMQSSPQAVGRDKP